MIDSSAIILDTETTDFENCEVMELAWAAYAGEGKLCKRYRPSKHPTYGAVSTHHILLEDLEACPPSSEVHRDLPVAEYWIGHNIDFDWRALGSPPGIKRICTLALSRRLWPEVDSHSLSAMMYFLHGQNSATRERVLRAHSAADDVEMTKDLLEVIEGQIRTQSLEDLYEESEEARIPRIWTFGKFKGQPIAAADKGYANWYRRQADPDPYVIEALRRERLI